MHLHWNTGITACFKHVSSKTWVYSIAINIKKLLEITVRFHQVRFCGICNFSISIYIEVCSAAVGEVRGAYQGLVGCHSSQAFQGVCLDAGQQMQSPSKQCSCNLQKH